MRASGPHLGGVIAALAGLGAGWLLARGGLQAPAHDTPSLDKSSQAPARPLRTSSTYPDRDYASYLRRFSASGPDADAVASVERMDSADLRTVLLDSPASAISVHRDARNELHHRIMIVAAAELFRREGPAALEWADASDSIPTRLAVLAALCATDPEAGMARLQAFEDDCGSKDHYRTVFANAAIGSAAIRGPADLILAEKTWSKFADTGEIDLPDDFDFAAYVKLQGVGSGSDRTLHAVTRAWAATDPGQVLEKLPDLTGPLNGGGQLVGVAMSGRAAMVGDEEAIRWGLDLLPALSGGQRYSAIDSITHLFDLSPQTAVEIVGSLPQDDDRIAFAITMLQKHDLKSETFRATLNALPTKSLRVQFFTRMLESDGSAQTGMSPRKLERFKDSLEEIGLSPECRRAILSTLPPSVPPDDDF
ncbi:hypothetical protein OJ996_00565 [Luteolibacter sp. GHJ8]|uniref:HEAT repeat domain-containing protein n=1 Tax=Luteolibacter rhizosphaerae TaxID=2989719 RepID=A0ABT3FXP1_9BACT|nr:hypothetical protein [Luteolibacter rhizosphaerae]MCW1912046.1 hypothetical protein [Luteolibacter rhizosphaerae]